jgi:hypothetical protein
MKEQMRAEFELTDFFIDLPKEMKSNKNGKYINSTLNGEFELFCLGYQAALSAVPAQEPVNCRHAKPQCDLCAKGLYEQCRYTTQQPAQEPVQFQDRVQPWMMECFGVEISADSIERNHRFLEESLELVQACGCTQSEAHQLVDYVFGRPIGEKEQEVGGVMVTLAALCLAQSVDMHKCGETELARVWTKVEQIRAKQAAKPKHSPLPQEPVKQEGKPIPLAQIGGILNEVMDNAVRNGANSISMPDEYVAVAHFLFYPEEYCLPVKQESKS